MFRRCTFCLQPDKLVHFQALNSTHGACSYRDWLSAVFNVRNLCYQPFVKVDLIVLLLKCVLQSYCPNACPKIENNYKRMKTNKQTNKGTDFGFYLWPPKLRTVRIQSVLCMSLGTKRVKKMRQETYFKIFEPNCKADPGNVCLLYTSDAADDRYVV